MNKILHILTILMIVLIIGCQKDEPKGVHSDVVALPSVEEELSLRRALLSLKDPRSTEKSLDAAVAKMRKGVEATYKNRQLLAEEMSRLGIAPSSEAAEYQRGVYTRTFTNKRCKTLEAIKAKLDAKGCAEAFEKNFQFDVRLEALLRMAYTNEVEVTDQDMANALRRIQDYNERADLTNAVIYATASNVCACAKAGGDFAKLVADYSNDDETFDGDVIGEFEESDFAHLSPSPWSALKALKVGDVTDVLDLDTGLYIFKAIRQDVDQGEEGSLPVMRFSRIVFRRVMYLPELSDAERRIVLEGDRRKKLKSKLLKSIVNRKNEGSMK